MYTTLTLFIASILQLSTDDIFVLSTDSACGHALHQISDRGALPPISWETLRQYQDPSFHKDRIASGYNSVSWLAEFYERILETRIWTFPKKDETPVMRFLAKGPTYIQHPSRVLMVGQSYYLDRMDICRLGKSPKLLGFVRLKRKGLKFGRIFQIPSGTEMEFEVVDGEMKGRFILSLDRFELQQVVEENSDESKWLRLRAGSFFYFQDKDENMTLHAPRDRD